MCATTLKFRHELKYYITKLDYLTLCARLSRVAEPDPYSGPDGTYLIRSLYFERPNDQVLQEKLNGVINREKFRIRYYNGDDSFVRLEKKMKVSTSTAKVSCRISRGECERILAGDTEWMCGDSRELLNELYAKMKYQQLRPKTVVDYVRECFLYRPGNVRISIDSEIKTGVSGIRLFDTELPTIKPFGVPVIIMEIKYDTFLPSIIKALVQLPNRRVSTFSKYASARMYG